MTWNATTGQIIYRSSRSWHTKCNFQIFTASDFLAAAVEHIPPRGQQTVRYYGLYSNKRRGMDAKARKRQPDSFLAAFIHHPRRATLGIRRWILPRLKKFQQKPARSGPFLITQDHSRPEEITYTTLKTGTAP